MISLSLSTVALFQQISIKHSKSTVCLSSRFWQTLPHLAAALIVCCSLVLRDGLSFGAAAGGPRSALGAWSALASAPRAVLSERGSRRQKAMEGGQIEGTFRWLRFVASRFLPDSSIGFAARGCLSGQGRRGHICRCHARGPTSPEHPSSTTQGQGLLVLVVWGCRDGAVLPDGLSSFRMYTYCSWLYPYWCAPIPIYPIWSNNK